ncbi:hypothetical protein Csp2054_13160 [Curtobacterium sp. 'Ferrero']|uniref:ComEC/Rec2 family competence protein n=1 Tax=Curtobacterium sp. 'Ferrero' TaxID=2033654 RepID=UPI000BDC839E|nr:ComEC/Rec2 family competence protein [Curtobacterium sp. 'Ferrero']PCN47225.1 hypothetical protein Csp2054_13160 [Curtobacterium sp. 'Ferrero']
MSASDGAGGAARATLGARLADLRTAGPAAIGWVVVAVLVGVPEAAVAVTVAAVVVAGLGVLLLTRSRSDAGTLRWGSSRAGVVAAIASVCVIASLLVALLGVAVVVGQERRQPGAVVEAAGRTASVVVTLDRDLGPGDRSVTGRLTEIRADRDLRVPVRLVPDAGAVPGRIAAGAVVRASAVLEPDAAGSPSAAVLFVRGPLAVEPPAGFAAVTDHARRAFAAVTSRLPEPGGTLLRGLAIGDRNGLDPDTEAAMERAALTHLTAVSGANCAVVIGLVVLLGRACGLPRVARVVVAVPLLLAFVALVRPDPSIVRASVMAVVVLVVHLAGRPARGVPLIALAVIGMLVADPWYARSFAFALSVLATTGIVVVAPPLVDLLARRLWTPVAAAVAVPVAAQLACWPVTIPLAPTVPTYAVPANLVTEPLAPVVTVVGLGSCLLAPVWPDGASVLAAVAWVPATAIGGVAHGVDALPAASAPWPAGVVGVVLAATVCAGVVVAVFVRGLLRLCSLLAAAVVLVVGIGLVAVPELVVRGSVPDDWTMAACDVGQGDAVLLRSAGATALVDTGDDPVLLRACLVLLEVRQIDLLVLTHFDRDHVGAVGEVVQDVVQAMVGPTGRPADERTVRTLRDAGVDVRTPTAGAGGRIGDLGFEVLWPGPGAVPGNAASIVLRTTPGPGCTGCVSAVLLGDLGEAAQRRLRTHGGADERVDVVKVSHHGSADQDPALYRALGARVGLIGVGADNSYGHPTRALLDTLRAVGTTAFRTDLDGTIVVTGTAAGPRVWTERSESAARAATPEAAREAPRTTGPPAASAASVGGRRIDSATTSPPVAAPEGPHARQEARARHREDRPGPVVGDPARTGRARHRPGAVPGRARSRRPP